MSNSEGTLVTDLGVEEMMFGAGVANHGSADRRGIEPAQEGTSSVSSFSPPRHGDNESQTIHRLADSLARVLLEAVRDWQDQGGQAGQEVNTRLQQQKEQLEAAVEGILDLRTRVEALSDSVLQHDAAHRQAFGEVENELTALKQINVLHESAFGDFDKRLEAVSRTSVEHVKALCDNVASLAERLDRQAAAIRKIQEAQQQGETCLGQLAETLLQMKAVNISTPAEQPL